MIHVPCLFRMLLIASLVVLIKHLPAQQRNPFLPDTVNSIHIQTSVQHGGYRRAMDPSQMTATGIVGKGTAELGAWRLGGCFSYQRKSRQDVYFSGVADAYNSNPFFWGDSLSGDWQDDIVEAEASLRTPRIGRHQLGLQVDYGTSIGVRTSDPKPLYRLRGVSVAAEYRLRLSPKKELLVRPEYQNAFEENEIGYETQHNAFVIRSRGYGALVESSLANMDRRRQSETWGGGLAIQEPDGWYVAAAASMKTDRTTEGVADPVPDGDYRLMVLSIQAVYPIGRVEPSLYFDYGHGTGESYLSSTSEQGSYAYRAVRNVFYDGWDWGVSVDWKSGSWCFLQTLGGGVSLESNRQEDALSESLYAYTNAEANLHSDFSFRAFHVKLGVAYRHKLAGTAEVAHPTRLSHTLFGPDYQYHTVHAFRWSCSGRWYCLDRIMGQETRRFWLQLASQGVAAAPDKRMGYTLSLGIDFHHIKKL